MRDACIGDCSRIDAVPSHALILTPEEIDWSTLEEYEEEVEDSEEDHHCQGGVDDPAVYRLDADAEKEDGDGEADEDRCDNVEELA
jgi:hypothetical protein